MQPPRRRTRARGRHRAGWRRRGSGRARRAGHGCGSWNGRSGRPSMVATMFSPQPARLAERVLGGRRADTRPMLASGTAAESPAAHAPGTGRPRRRRAPEGTRRRDTLPCAVDREPRPLGERVRADAGRPHERLGGEHLAVGQAHDPALGRVEPGVEADLDPTVREQALGVPGEVVADLGEDACPSPRPAPSAAGHRAARGSAPCASRHEVLQLARAPPPRRSRRPRTRR